jgi:hypothetical protein
VIKLERYHAKANFIESRQRETRHSTQIHTHTIPTGIRRLVDIMNGMRWNAKQRHDDKWVVRQSKRRVRMRRYEANQVVG